MSRKSGGALTYTGAKCNHEDFCGAYWRALCCRWRAAGNEDGAVAAQLVGRAGERARPDRGKGACDLWQHASSTVLLATLTQGLFGYVANAAVEAEAPSRTLLGASAAQAGARATNADACLTGCAPELLMSPPCSFAIFPGYRLSRPPELAPPASTQHD